LLAAKPPKGRAETMAKSPLDAVTGYTIIDRTRVAEEMKRSSSPRLVVTRSRAAKMWPTSWRSGGAVKIGGGRMWNRCRRATHRMTERIAFRGHWGDL
jgi:hypothetical protein